MRRLLVLTIVWLSLPLLTSAQSLPEADTERSRPNLQIFSEAALTRAVSDSGVRLTRIRQRDSLWNGTLSGTIIGTLGGIAFAVTTFESDAVAGFATVPVFALVGAGVGAALGAGIDALLDKANSSKWSTARDELRASRR